MVGCGSADVEVYLAEVMPFGDRAVATEVIFPGPAAAYLLGKRWPPPQAVERTGMWVRGTWAALGFYAAVPGNHTLVARARPYTFAAAPTQFIHVELNGEEIISEPMRRGWHEYEFELPGDRVEYGWNDVTFRFRHSIRPADYNPDSDDRRNLAAQFRRLEIRAPSGRAPRANVVGNVTLTRPGGLSAGSVALDTPPVAAEIADEVADDPAGMAPISIEPHEDVDDLAAAGAVEEEVPAGTAEEPSRADEEIGEDKALVSAAPPDPAEITIEMLTDSFFELIVAPTSDTTIRGVVTASFDGGEGNGGGEIHTLIEVEDANTTWEMFNASFGPNDDRTVEADVSLGEWAGELVRLRVRAWGSTNGTVSWARLGMTTPLIDTSRFPDAPGERVAPTITVLANEGTRFDSTWSPSSWTGQSMPALLTGMTPDAVGMEHWGSRLPEPVVNFPELLMEAGYHTVLWSQHNIYRSNSTLRRGFATFTEVRSNIQEDRDLLPGADELFINDKPTFALIHLLAPHAPYEPPAPFMGTRSSWSAAGFDISGPRLSRLNQEISSPEELEIITRYARDRYDENVSYVDHLIGRLLQTFKDAGRYDDALIVILADHGEAFNEHGLFLHTRWLFEEFIHVPLVMKWPASVTGFAAVVEQPVSLLDLAPTLIDALGIEDERARYNGLSLMPVIFDDAAPDRVLYAYTRGIAAPAGRARPEHALRWGDLKLRFNVFNEDMTFVDLAGDPGETIDASRDHPIQMRYLRQALQFARYRNATFLASVGNASFESLDADTIAKLKALGYLQ